MLTTLFMLAVSTSACREDGITSNTLIQEGVSITPAVAEVQIGSTIQLSAQLFDENGDLIPGQAFSWFTPDASIATVNASGVVSAVGPGTVTIAAITADQSQSGFADVVVVSGEGGGEGGGGGGGGGSTGGTSGANILDVPSSNAAAGSREPAGLTPIGLSHFDSFGTFMGIDSSGRAKHELPEGGVHFYGGGVQGGTAGSRASHTSAGRVRILMPKGCMGTSGTSCGTMLTHAMARSASQPDQVGYHREMYARFGMRVDGNYWVHPAGNKVASHMWHNSQTGKTNNGGWIKVYPGGGVDRWPGQQIQNAPHAPRIGWAYGHSICGYPVNHRGSASIPHNQDVVVEFWIRMATGPCATDGAVKVWLDGQLAVDLQNVPTWDGSATNASLGGGDQVWGLKIQHILGGLCGSPPCPSADMYIEHDYLYLSAR